MKTCKGCKWAEWNRTASGRLHPNGGGRCTFQVKIPVLPQAFYWIGGEPRPMGGQINRKEEHKDHCAYYAPETPQ